MLTMLLGGLWHGASWRFMFWGGIHGVGLALERALGVEPDKKEPLWRAWPRILLTFSIVTIAWALFRADSVASAGLLLQQAGNALLQMREEAELWGALLSAQALSLGLMLACFAMQLLPGEWLVKARGPLSKLAPALKAVALALFLLLVWQFQGAGSQPFIYFQF